MTSSSFCVVYIPEVLLINEKTRQILDVEISSPFSIYFYIFFFFFTLTQCLFVVFFYHAINHVYTSLRLFLQNNNNDLTEKKIQTKHKNYVKVSSLQCSINQKSRDGVHNWPSKTIFKAYLSLLRRYFSVNHQIFKWQ